MMKIIYTEDVDVLRRKAYPPLEDFADAWVHLQRGDGEMMEAYLAECARVKMAFPKKHDPVSDVAALHFGKMSG